MEANKLLFWIYKYKLNPKSFIKNNNIWYHINKNLEGIAFLLDLLWFHLKVSQIVPLLPAYPFLLETPLQSQFHPI